MLTNPVKVVLQACNMWHISAPFKSIVVPDHYQTTIGSVAVLGGSLLRVSWHRHLSVKKPVLP